MSAGAEWAAGRLGVPPSDDEREALAQALFRTLYDAGVSFQSGDLIPRLTATVRAAGFRRQGPPSDDEREALDQIMREADGCWPDAREAILATFRRQGPITKSAARKGYYTIPERQRKRLTFESWLAALEAAERARSAVPSPTEQEDQ